MLFVITLLIFIGASILHLYRRRYHGREIVGHISKMFLIPFLYTSIFLFANMHEIVLQLPSIIVLIAIFYTMGDLLLLFKKKAILFYLGALSFLLGHIMYIVYFTHFSFSFVAAFVGVMFSLFFLCRYLKKVHSKVPGKELPYLLYGSGIVALTIAVFSFFSIEHIIAWLVAFSGVVVFGYSDSRIVYNNVGYEESSSFKIMLTYIIANIFLVLAIMLLNL